MLSLLFIPQLEDQRASLGSYALGKLIGEDFQVRGDLRLVPGSQIRIEGFDVLLPDDDDDGAIEAERVKIIFPARAALAGRLAPTNVEISGLRFAIDAREAKTENEATVTALGHVVRWLLATDLSPRASLDDLRIVREGDPDGWNGEIHFAAITAQHRNDALEFGANGTLSGARFTIAGTVAATSETQEAGRPLSATLTLPATDIAFDGAIDPEAETLDLALSTKVNSFTQLLKTLRLETQGDGTADLEARLDGSYGSLAARDIDLVLALDDGVGARVAGGIGDLWSAEEIGLDVALDLAARMSEETRPPSALDIRVGSATGKIWGSLKALSVSDVQVSTNLASAQLAEIGPIRVGTIARDSAGRLAFLDVHLVQGDPAQPVLDLTGDFHDVIGLRDLAFGGSFNIDPVAALSGPSGAGGPRLLGEIEVSDAGGELGIAGLDAQTTGGDAFTLAIAKAKEAAPIRVAFSTPDIDAFLALFGQPTAGGGAASLEVDLTMAEGLMLGGSGKVGESAFRVSLNGAVPGGRPVLSGEIDARSLSAKDLPRAAAIGNALGGSYRGASLNSGVAESFKAELDLSVERFAAIEAAGGLEAHLSYAEERALVKPLRLTVLNGKLDAALRVEPDGDSHSVAFGGQLRALELGELLRHLEVEPLIEGGLDTEFDLYANGLSFSTFRQTLGGTLSMSMHDARLRTRLIDLAGQDMLAWLLADGGRGDARLVCLIVGMGFKSGVGTIQELVAETENVQLVADGSVDLEAETLDIHFVPRPLREGLVDAVTEFTVSGSLGAPKISTGSMANRLVAESIALPIKPLELLVKRLGTEEPTTRQPCVVLDGG